jgi:hypothetical protein
MHSEAGGSLQQYADLEALVHAAAAGVGASDVAGTSAAEEKVEEEEEEEDHAAARWTQYLDINPLLPTTIWILTSLSLA